MKSVHEREEFRTVDSLATAVQWSAFNAVELRSRSAAKNLQLDPGPATSAKARILCACSSRPIATQPEATMGGADAIRETVDVVLTGVSLGAWRRDSSPVRRDYASKPEGGANGGFYPGFRDKVLGSVAGLDLVVSGTFPVPVQLRLGGSVIARAQ